MRKSEDRKPLKNAKVLHLKVRKNESAVELPRRRAKSREANDLEVDPKSDPDLMTENEDLPAGRIEDRRNLTAEIERKDREVDLEVDRKAR